MSLEYLQQIGKAKDAVKTIADTAVGKVAQDFAQKTVDQMREDAPSASGTLKSSITFEFSFEGEKLKIKFFADDYWDYVNSGVDGVERSAGALPNYSESGTPYSFKTLNPSRKMVDAFSGEGSMQNWMASKGIIAENGDYRSLAYLLARATKRHGIEPTPFVNEAFTEEKMRAFEEAILDAFENLI